MTSAKYSAAIIGAALLAFAAPAFADPDKDESGNRSHRGWKYSASDYEQDRERRGRKEEYWDGNCKIERKWKKNGDYKEERKCRAAEPEPVSYEPGIVISLPPVIITPR